MRRVGFYISTLGVILACAAAIGADRADGPEQIQLPDEVTAELNYLVGTWDVKGRAGDMRYEGTQTTKWAPGKHCLVTNWQGTVGEIPVNGTAIVGWDALEKQILDVGFISNVGHRTMRWSIETPKVWEGTMSANSFGDKVQTAIRLEKKSADECVVVINASGDFAENEYLFKRTAAKDTTRPKKKAE